MSNPKPEYDPLKPELKLDPNLYETLNAIVICILETQDKLL